ncbi:hypothetical protein ACLB2K_042878 [Fragaria x ananassa]
MWRKAFTLLKHRPYSSSPEIPTLYSFLQPSIFALKTPPSTHSDLPTPPPKTLSPDHVSTLETTLHKSLLTHNTDEAWKSFKSLTGSSVFPSKSLTNSMITHLASLGEIHNLKRAFASVVYVVEKSPELLEFETVGSVLGAMNCANIAAPAFALIQCMFKNRVALEEKMEVMKPDLAACNAALEACCCELESVSGAEKVVETMVGLGVRPDECSFGFLAYLYALKGLGEKISELEGLMGGFGFSDRRVFRNNLINGFNTGRPVQRDMEPKKNVNNDLHQKLWTNSFVVYKIGFKKSNVKLDRGKPVFDVEEPSLYTGDGDRSNYFKLFEVESIGDEVLFVGDNYSFSVLASDYPGCQPNSIYYTDDFMETPLHEGYSTLVLMTPAVVEVAFSDAVEGEDTKDLRPVYSS